MMTIFDLLITSICVISFIILSNRKSKLQRGKYSLGFFFVVIGLSIISLFYFYDLLAMWIFPLFMDHSIAMSLMEDLHLNYSWFSNLFGISFILFGFILINNSIDTLTIELLTYEERLNTIVNNTNSVIYMKDLKGRYLLINKRWEDLFGIKNKELQGKTDLEFFPKEIAEDFMKNDRKVMESGKPFEGEEVAPHEDGLHNYISIKVPLFNSNGDVYGLCGISTDITERKKMEEELKKHQNKLEELVAFRTSELEESENKFKSYFEMPISGVAIFDTEGRWVEINDRMCEIVGYSREELLGFVWTEATYPDDIKPCISLIDEIKDKKRDRYTVEKRYVGKNGKITYVEASVGCVRNKEGDPGYYVALVQDISARKNDEKELDKHRSHLEELIKKRNIDILKKNEELESFTYAASHDLLEPLRKITTFGDLLKESCLDKLDKKEVSYIGKIEKAAFRMKSLIDDLLHYSRFAKSNARFEPIGLNEIIQEVLDDLEVQISEVKGDVLVDSLPNIEADKIQMRQLFQNLISNGLKYRRPNIPPKIIITSVPNDNGLYKLSVEDNGIGIEKKYRDKVFEPFKRINGLTKAMGSGMGLFICSKIVDRHNGTISVESNNNEGATFIILLPEKQTRTSQNVSLNTQVTSK